jgi:predicted esterase
VPFWTAEGFKEAYAWYFRDTDRGFTIVSPEEMADRVQLILTELDLVRLPIVIFGFSQGGYLAPFAGRLMPNLKAIISLGSGYPKGPYSRLPKTAVYGLHGEEDERIPFEASKVAHADLLKAGFKGEFFAFPGLKHKVDPAVEPLVRRLAVKELGLE